MEGINFLSVNNFRNLDLIEASRRQHTIQRANNLDLHIKDS